VKKLRIGVIYGGRSSEHEVSLASAASVIANLDRQRYEPVPIRIDRDGRWSIADKAPTAMVAGEVIARARLESGRSARPPKEAFLVPHPGEETLVTVGLATAHRVILQGTNRLGRAIELAIEGDELAKYLLRRARKGRAVPPKIKVTGFGP